MKVNIPVRYVEGAWVMSDGRQVPAEGGTFGELRLRAAQLTDKQLRESLTETRWVKVLEEGATLCVAVTPRYLSQPELVKLFVDPDEFKRTYTTRISASSRFVPVHIAAPTDMQKQRGEDSGGLWLRLSGMEDATIESSRIKLPALLGRDSKIVNSLNHCFTAISEVFEDGRISHTGNIYRRIYYQESDGIWYPLGDLRDYAGATADRKIAWALREAVATQSANSTAGAK